MTTDNDGRLWTDEDRADALRLRGMLVAEVQRSRRLEAAARGLLAALDAMWVDGTATENAAYADATDAMRKAVG